jgi:HlyD family secretion protein
VDIPRAPARRRKRYIYIGAGVVAAVLTSLALTRLEPAPPTVDRAVVFTDTVKRGPMVRQVRGTGTLVPEEVRWITAVTQGRVEEKLVEPGAQVDENTVLLRLSNPDVELQALEADRQLNSAELELVNLRASLETQRLSQEATVASAQMQYNEAMRRYEAQKELAERGLTSQHELAQARDAAEEAARRLEIEKQRLEVLSRAQAAQIRSQEEQIHRLRGIVRFRRQQLESMTVRAGAEGVVQELPLEVGMWANAGATLAKVVQPGRLKAVLRVPETQIRDVAVGQPAIIDTRNGTIPGRVVRIDPAAVSGTVGVDVKLEGELPPGARPDLSVDGVIEVERLDDVVYMARPAYGQANSTIGIFKLEPGGNTAVRVNVRLGRSSVHTIEVVSGLQPGDVVILSDMSQWDEYDRVRLR